MGGSNENFSVGARHNSYAPGALKKLPISGCSSSGSNWRRPLSTINGNIIGPQRREKILDACVPVHCPITRKFAAQLSTKEQPPLLEEVKPSFALPLTTSHEDEDCIINDAEYYNNPIDYDVPMFVQHTEAMMEEIDRMDAEIEMQDIEHDELVLNIDSCDKNDPLAANEYIDDLYVYYKKMEVLSCVPTNYMENQFDINERMRGILIDWLIEVHYKFELMEETLYLTVNLIDRFLAIYSVVRKKLQLVGVTAMLLACKYEEVSVPAVEDLIHITDKAYGRHQVLEMEKLMINTLKFNLSLPTPYVFMRRFLKAAQSDTRLELLSFFIIELCLVEYEMLRFPPSLLAAASIFTGQCTLSGHKQQWSKTSEKYTSYTENRLMECAKLMVSLHRKAGDGELRGVYKKYITSKYGYAARVEPALFLTDDGLIG